MTVVVIQSDCRGVDSVSLVNRGPIARLVAKIKIHVMDQHFSQSGRDDYFRPWFLPGGVADDPLPGIGRHSRGCCSESVGGLPYLLDQVRQAVCSCLDCAGPCRQLSYS
jgi:hypothetical protein